MKTTAKEAYSEILKLLKKYRDVCVFDVDDLERMSRCHLFGIELKEEHGFNIDPKEVRSLDWLALGDYLYVGRWGRKVGRTISCPDDKKQPEDELLLCISFPTGPYIFGDHYPVSLFQKLFFELKSFGAKYTDSHNNSLYFSMENAGRVFNSFNGVMERYRELNREDLKQRQIKKMKEKLKELEGPDGGL